MKVTCARSNRTCLWAPDAQCGTRPCTISVKQTWGIRPFVLSQIGFFF